MKILPNIRSLKPLLVASLLFSAFVAGSVQAQNVDNVEREEPISQAELEQVLAPIALYPDTILSHILVASTYPLEVVQAERWALRNPELKGQDAVEAVAEFDWDPSVQALVAFPQVLKRLSQDLDWTQRLGDAFLADEEQVLASVQNLRELAEEAGSLDEMEKVTVTRDDSSIIIEPREREIVYVPYYDTRVVYGNWRWRHYQPVYWDYPYANSLYYDDFYARSPFYWGPRISLSFGFFFNTFHWSNRHLVRISSRHYRPHRYYRHRDIVDHRYARRWVHDRNRRHGNRNRHISHRGGGKSGVEGVEYQNNQVRHSQTRRGSNQERVRDGLQRQRNNQIRTNRVGVGRVHANSSRRVATRQNRPEINQSRAVNRNTATNRPTGNSRVVVPNRHRSIENNRRVANRQATQPANRPAATARSQPRPAVRPATRPAQQQRASRPAVKPRAAPPRAVAVERKPTPNKGRSTGRGERRQPR